MTKENRLFVGLKDLIGVEFVCVNCKAKVVLPPDRWAKFPRSCPSCDHKWIDDRKESVPFGALFYMLDGIRKLAECLGKRDIVKVESSSYVGCNVNFQISEGDEDGEGN